MRVERSEKLVVAKIGTVGDEVLFDDTGEVDEAVVGTFSVGKLEVVTGELPKLFFSDSTASCCMYICMSAGFCRFMNRLRRLSEAEVTGGKVMGRVGRIGVGGVVFSSVLGDWVPRAAAAKAAAPGSTGIMHSEI